MFRDFFTWKTSDQIRDESNESRLKEERRKDSYSAPPVPGLFGMVETKRQEAELLEAKIKGFFEDVQSIFDRCGLGEFTGRDYAPSVKYDEVTEGGGRSLAMKWTGHLTSKPFDLVTTVAFVIAESESGVRVDFIVNVAPNPLRDEGWSRPGGSMLVEKRKELADPMYTDDYHRAVRYKDFVEFKNAVVVPPDWFTSFARQSIKPKPTRA